MFKIIILLLCSTLLYSEDAMNRISIKIDGVLYVSAYPLNESKGATIKDILSGSWHPATEAKSGIVAVNFSSMVQLPIGKVDAVGFYNEELSIIVQSMPLKFELPNVNGGDHTKPTREAKQSKSEVTTSKDKLSLLPVSP